MITSPGGRRRRAVPSGVADMDERRVRRRGGPASTVALGCFSAVVAGHRKAAWAAVGMLWSGHVLIAHWLYEWRPPFGDEAAS